MEKDQDIHLAKIVANPLARILLISVGCLFVGLGAIGAIVPGLPTTVFLVLAAACFIRSSQKLYDRLITNRTFGPYLKDYREGKGIPLKAKIMALALIVIFVSYAVFFAVQITEIRILVGLVGLIGFWFVCFKVPVAYSFVAHDRK
ncbi:MAG TPA: YbaN family protein [Vicinamibacterales bacterium]|jgi:hypothetical protein|nr:YbaN family protein [Vicinamibacterales bacterium]|tara:strand:- start:366 stop:803 length:438 start_codon:yes stop_codon:yes gene_type:complete